MLVADGGRGSDGVEVGDAGAGGCIAGAACSNANVSSALLGSLKSATCAVPGLSSTARSSNRNVNEVVGAMPLLRVALQNVSRQNVLTRRY